MMLFRVQPDKPFSGPHQGQPVLESGAAASRAKAGMIMLHGRGATARGILSLSDEFAQPDVLYIAPQAASQTWYPLPFTDPVEKNEFWLNSALQWIYDLIHQMNQASIPTNRIVLLGFSQGACLALEYAARHPERFGGIISLSGGLIGNKLKRDAYTGNLQNTPVLIGAGENDPYFSMNRIHQSAEIFDHLGGNVSKQIYPDKGHTIVEDEVKFVRGILASVIQNVKI